MAWATCYLVGGRTLEEEQVWNTCVLTSGFCRFFTCLVFVFFLFFGGGVGVLFCSVFYSKGFWSIYYVPVKGFRIWARDIRIVLARFEI